MSPSAAGGRWRQYALPAVALSAIAVLVLAVTLLNKNDSKPEPSSSSTTSIMSADSVQSGGMFSSTSSRSSSTSSSSSSSSSSSVVVNSANVQSSKMDPSSPVVAAKQMDVRDAVGADNTPAGDIEAQVRATILILSVSIRQDRLIAPTVRKAKR